MTRGSSTFASAGMPTCDLFPAHSCALPPKVAEPTVPCQHHRHGLALSGSFGRVAFDCVNEHPSLYAGGGRNALAFEHMTNVFGLGQDASARKTNLAKTGDVAKFFAAVFQQHDSALESQPTLEQAV